VVHTALAWLLVQPLWLQGRGRLSAHALCPPAPIELGCALKANRHCSPPANPYQSSTANTHSCPTSTVVPLHPYVYHNQPRSLPLLPSPLPLCSKPVWAALAAAATSELQAQRFDPLTPPAARSLLEGGPLGVARLRLLPKRLGMRPIIRLGCPSTVTFGRAAGGSGVGGGVGGGGGVGRGRAATHPPASGGQQVQLPRLPAGAGGAAPGAGGSRRGGLKRRRAAAGGSGGAGGSVTLSFAPVNWVLQPAFQVGEEWGARELRGATYQVNCGPRLE
jgi:hypothetical protein